MFDFLGSFFGQIENITLYLKVISQFVLGNTYLHQTFTECVSNQYAYSDKPGVTASYATPFDFIAY